LLYSFPFMESFFIWGVLYGVPIYTPPHPLHKYRYTYLDLAYLSTIVSLLFLVIILGANFEVHV
jgi:hypothetical protein